MPSHGTHSGSPEGPSAQAPEATPNGKHPTGQAQQIEPNAQPPKGQRTNRAQQEPPTPPQPRAQERLNGQARPQTPGTAGEFNNAPRNAFAARLGHPRPSLATTGRKRRTAKLDKPPLRWNREAGPAKLGR
jgi:hypothetical protein